MNPGPGEVVEEDLPNLFVPVRKFAQDLAQRSHHVVLRKCHDPGHNASRDIVRGGSKRAQ
jgi:hypothetical protein